MAKAVIIDTSSILFGFANRHDVFDAVRASLPGHVQTISKGVVRELTGIASGNGKRAASAKAALEAIKYKKIVIDNIDREVDSWVYSRAAEDPEIVVVSNDTELCGRVKAAGARCLKLGRDGLLR